MKVGQYEIGGAVGIVPKTIGATEDSASVRAQSWGWTLAVVAVAAIGGGLSIKVQDSADDSTFNDVVGSTFAASANSVHLVLIKHSAVREYVRIRAIGTTSPVASIALVRLNDASGSLVGSVDKLII